MKLYGMELTRSKDDIKVSIKITSKKQDNKTLWFSTKKKYAEYICDCQYDAFLVGLLYPAMVNHEDIIVEGKVSNKLLFNINNYVIPLLKSFSPECKEIKVYANEVSNVNFNGNGVGTGFSGGVDSFGTIYDHLELEENPDYKINSFLFLNVGSHGFKDQEKVNEKFYKRYKYLKKFPDEINLDFIPVNSNLYKFHPWGHRKTHTLTSAAGVLFMQKLYKRYYYSSSGLNYSDAIKAAPKYRDITTGMYCEYILLPLLNTESIDFIADGTKYDRVDKTIKILNYEPVYRYLNVCVSGDNTHKNCSICNKCCRTLMTLESLGKLEKFERLFDVNKYRKKARKRYMRLQVLKQNRDTFAKNNVDLAKKYNIKLPSKISAFLIEGPRILIRKVLKSFTNNYRKKKIR